MAESTYTFLIQDALSTGRGSGGGGSDVKDDFDDEKEDNRRTNKKSLQQQIGIQLTLAGILKQSAIFTGFIGSLFQIVGAFVDTLLMGTFPLLKSSLKYIMKFFDPLKDAAAGIGTVIEFVMKIANKLDFGGPKGGLGDTPLTEVGNILSYSNMGSKGPTKLGQKVPYLGQFFNSLQLIGDLSSNPEVIDKAVAVTQTIATMLASFGIGIGAGASALPSGGVSIAAGGAGIIAYDVTVRPIVDQLIKDAIYGMFGRTQEDVAYSQTPMD